MSLASFLCRATGHNLCSTPLRQIGLRRDDVFWQWFNFLTRWRLVGWDEENIFPAVKVRIEISAHGFYVFFRRKLIMGCDAEGTVGGWLHRWKVGAKSEGCAFLRLMSSSILLPVINCSQLFPKLHSWRSPSPRNKKSQPVCICTQGGSYFGRLST